MSKKILHVLNDLNHSGAEKMLYDTAGIFQNEGFDSTILSLVTKGSDGFEIKLEEKRYKIIKLNFSRNKRFLIELFQILRARKFDLVHIHTESAFFWLVLICKLAGVKKICRTVHSNFEFRGYLLFRRLIQRQIASKIFGLQYIAISDSVQKNEKERFKINTTLINNYVDVELFNPSNYSNESNSSFKKELGIDPECLVITTIGSCSDIKNHSVALQVIKEVRDAGVNAIYIHVGKGVLECEEKLFAETLGISGSVRFLGNTLRTPEILSITDIYLMPSSYEGVGLACIEALSMNCLVIVNNTIGLNSLVKQGYNGYLIDGNTVEGYRLIITDFAKNPAKYDPVRLRSREMVSKEYDIKNSAQKYIQFYKSLVA